MGASLIPQGRARCQDPAPFSAWQPYSPSPHPLSSHNGTLDRVGTPTAPLFRACAANGCRHENAKFNVHLLFRGPGGFGDLHRHLAEQKGQHASPNLTLYSLVATRTHFSRHAPSCCFSFLSGIKHKIIFLDTRERFLIKDTQSRHLLSSEPRDLTHPPPQPSCAEYDYCCITIAIMS